jgi:hypothetical protein
MEYGPSNSLSIYCAPHLNFYVMKRNSHTEEELKKTHRQKIWKFLRKNFE